MKLFLSLTGFPLACASFAAQPAREPVESPPDTPAIFAPGVICLPDRKEGNPTFSPDGRELFFTVVNPNGTLSIYESRFSEGHWSMPVRSAFNDEHSNWEPFLTPDGQRLFFLSTRPPGVPKWNGRIWWMQRDGRAWTAPRLVELGFQPRKGVWFPSLDRHDRLYFGAYGEAGHSLGKSDLYSVPLASSSQPPENLGAAINSPHEEWDPFIAPDGSYLLFQSDRPGGLGGVDIYISFRRGDGWLSPQSLGPGINSSGNEVAARVSPDGKTLFFDRTVDGGQDIYWVSAAIINELRAKILPR